MKLLSGLGGGGGANPASAPAPAPTRAPTAPVQEEGPSASARAETSGPARAGRRAGRPRGSSAVSGSSLPTGGGDIFDSLLGGDLPGPGGKASKDKTLSGAGATERDTRTDKQGDTYRQEEGAEARRREGR